jgi:tryptophan-rich sensory protein
MLCINIESYMSMKKKFVQKSIYVFQLHQLINFDYNNLFVPLANTIRAKAVIMLLNMQ